MCADATLSSKWLNQKQKEGEREEEKKSTQSILLLVGHCAKCFCVIYVTWIAKKDISLLESLNK